MADQRHISARHTSNSVVIPYYMYASLAFLAATVLLFLSAPALTGHYFHPKILAITHIMALGWGTMIIFGAGHQLLPVLTGSRLFSVPLGHLSFILAAIGIPVLVHAFYFFQLDWMAQCGGSAIVLSMLFYVINTAATVAKGKKENIHGIFFLTATLWLLLTGTLGLTLLFNFTAPFLPEGALAYLPLHAHIGITGWFLLLIIGVGSRLMPMFLISKYQNEKLLWWIYFLINGGLISFLALFLFHQHVCYWLPVTAIGTALFLFVYYCYACHRQRIRRRVDPQMRTSLTSTAIMFLTLPLLITITLLSNSGTDTRQVMLYGFGTFFGWITAIVLGMTFKTLPFIVWNKIYGTNAGTGKTPNPAQLMSARLFNGMILAWIAGWLFCAAGISTPNITCLKAGSICLVAAALLYNANVLKVLTHKRTL